MAGTKPRDSQKQRLYDAQRLAGFYDTGEVMTIKEAQKFVNQVLSHKKTKKLFNQYRFSMGGSCLTKIIVESGNGNHATTRNRNWEIVKLIRLNRFGRNKFIVLHEIAHHITWGREAHGAEFADVLLQFTTRYLGKPDANKLANAFNAKRVKVMTKTKKARVPRKRKTESARLVA